MGVLFEGDAAWKRLVSFGFYIRPWQTVPYREYDSIGRFEGERFDPEAWKPRVPTAAFLRSRADDNFWAARRVVAFSNEMIRAIVKTGGYSDPAAEKHLADVLIERREKIAKAYLRAVNPLVDFTLDEGGVLAFDNAAVRARVADPPKGGYKATWFRFDNDTGEATLIGESAPAWTTRLQAPAGLPDVPGMFVKVQVSAVDAVESSWHEPVGVYFRRTTGGWTLVGLDRLP